MRRFDEFRVAVHSDQTLSRVITRNISPEEQLKDINVIGIVTEYRLRRDTCNRESIVSRAVSLASPPRALQR